MSSLEERLMALARQEHQAAIEAELPMPRITFRAYLYARLCAELEAGRVTKQEKLEVMKKCPDIWAQLEKEAGRGD